MISENRNFDWPFIGNRQITNYLEKCMKNKHIPSGLVFNGPENLGKTTVAIRFAKILLCQSQDNKLPCGECPACLSFKRGEQDSQESNFSYSDFYLVKKDKDQQKLGIEKIRDLIHALNMSSFLGSYKIGIVKHADLMSLEAANALLKTLEEPKSKVIIILITDHLDRLPATIKSRLQIMQFKGVRADTIYDYLLKEKGASRSQAKEISRISIGRPALAVKLLEQKELLNEMRLQAMTFLNFKTQNINERLKAVNELIDQKISGQIAKRQGTRIIEIWQAVIRDLILFKTSHINLMQFSDESDLNQASFNFQGLSSWYQLLQNSKLQLRNNVNHKNVLENIAIQLGR